MNEPTELHLHWSGVFNASINVRHQQRALTADELRLVADVVESIETLRDDVREAVAS